MDAAGHMLDEIRIVNKRIYIQHLNPITLTAMAKCIKRGKTQRRLHYVTMQI